MILHSNCVCCKVKVPLKVNAKSKVKIQQLKGSTFSVICPSCNRNQPKTPHEIQASVSYKLIIYGFLMSILIAGLLWPMIGAPALLSVGIPISIWVLEINRIKAFNDFPMFD